ncbi:MAG: hypothetical protein P4M12_08035 [Gammaproteobacteria bacterium]|nr:hypothetical protein [Gammaproteobacteria bacterium]
MLLVNVSKQQQDFASAVLPPRYTSMLLVNVSKQQQDFASAVLPAVTPACF